MEKKIEDYLHLYIGCEVMLISEPESPEPNIKRLTGITSDYAGGKFYHLDDEQYHHEVSDIDFKPLLRKLADITATEYTNLTQVIMGYDGGRDRGAHAFQDMLFTIKSAPVFAYLLKQGFDLFGLIDASLALDKSTPT